MAIIVLKDHKITSQFMVITRHHKYAKTATFAPKIFSTKAEMISLVQQRSLASKNACQGSFAKKETVRSALLVIVVPTLD